MPIYSSNRLSNIGYVESTTNTEYTYENGINKLNESIIDTKMSITDFIESFDNTDLIEMRKTCFIEQELQSLNEEYRFNLFNTLKLVVIEIRKALKGIYDSLARKILKITELTAKNTGNKLYKFAQSNSAFGDIKLETYRKPKAGFESLKDLREDAMSVKNSIDQALENNVTPDQFKDQVVNKLLFYTIKNSRETTISSFDKDFNDYFFESADSNFSISDITKNEMQEIITNATTGKMYIRIIRNAEMKQDKALDNLQSELNDKIHSLKKVNPANDEVNANEMKRLMLEKAAVSAQQTFHTTFCNTILKSVRFIIEQDKNIINILSNYKADKGE